MLSESWTSEAGALVDPRQSTALWELLPAGIFRADAKGRCLYVNPSWCSIVGLSRDETRGRSLLSVVHPGDKSRVEAEWLQCGSKPFRSEFRIQDRAGRTTWVLAQAVATCETDGNVCGYLGTITDITERKRVEEALAINEARFRSAFGLAPEGMSLNSPDGRFLQVNRRLCQILGYSEAELLQLRFHDITHPADLEMSVSGAKALLEGKRTLLEFEKRYRRKDGQLVWVYLRTNLLFDGGGQPLYFVTHIQDITERKAAEVALRESEERYWRLVDLSNDGIIVHIQGKLVFSNPAAARLLGVGSRDDLIGRNVLDLVHADFKPVVQQRLRELDQGSTFLPFISEKLVTLDGREVHVEAAAVPFVFKGQTAVQVVFRDVTQAMEAKAERDRLFREVESARDELRLLSQRLVQVQEAERRHIARELHDEIGQELTALRLNIERNAAAVGADSAWRDALARVANLLQVVRELSLNLRPAMLDDLGLVPTLLWHLDRFQSSSGIKVSFKHCDVEGRRFPVEIETAAYRIIQEALTNVMRYAAVTEVQLALWISDSRRRLVIQVEDRGGGFNPQAVGQESSSGLSGMRERAMLLGGQLHIESGPGEGTCIKAELPLTPREEIQS